jgi:hypothetical protein
MCASDGAQQLCTIPCDLAPCPDGFSCVAAGDDLNVCWPSSPPLAAEPGCSAALDPAIWAALALLLMPRRRGRRAIASTHEQPAGCAARARD